VVRAQFFVRKALGGVEHVAETVQVHAPIEQPAAILALDSVGIGFFTVHGDVAYQRAHHVRQCDHALDVAVLVDDQSQLGPVLLEQLEQHHCADGFGHEQHVLHRMLDIDRLERAVAHRLGQQVAHLHEAQDLGAVATVDWEAAVGVASDQFERVAAFGVQVDHDQVDARRHQRFQVTVIQAQSARDDVIFGLFEQAGVGAFLEHAGDVFFGRCFFFSVMDAKQAHDRFGRQRQHLDERRHDQRQGRQRRGNQRCHRLRMAHRDAFRDQFAQHDRHERNGKHHDEERDFVGVGGKEAHHFDLRLQARDERGFTERTGKDADQCDAYLNGGKKMTRVVGQCDGAARAAAAFLRAPFEAHAFCGDERQFAHREHPVQEDQNEDDQYV
jgi:hypothetical protein